MKLSARNQFEGTVTNITQGQAMAEVSVKVGNLQFVAAITEGCSLRATGRLVSSYTDGAAAIYATVDHAAQAATIREQWRHGEPLLMSG